MAPEMLKGEPATVASDIYALGVVLWELLSGLRRALTTHSVQPYIDSYKVRPRAIARCVHPNPDKRFADADSVWRAMDPARARRIFMTAGAGTLLVAAGSFVWIKVPLGSGPGIPSLAVIPFSNVEGSTEDRFLSDGISEAIINALAELPELKVVAR